jgi:chitodextrinase
MMRQFRLATSLLCFGLFSGASAPGQQAVSVPALYQPVYSSADQALNSFRATIDAAWNGVLSPVDFAAELPSASSSVGSKLLDPDRYSAVLLQLDSLQALGVKAVNVQLYFPVLYRGYYSSEAEYQKYVAFYKRLAADVRSRGLKLIARCSLLMAQEGFSTVDAHSYYQSLTVDQYKAGRISTVVEVVREIRPDYVIVLNEPDVEAAQSGKPEVGSVAGSTDFLRAIVAAVRATGIPVNIGAGVGTWAARYDEFIQNMLSTGINFLDLHVYPVNRDFLPRLIQAADLAQAAGKGVTISEAWLQKVSDAELGGTPVQTLFARDPFSFWAPLDEKFLQVLVRFSHYKKLLFFSPFWTQYFHAYVDYDAVSSLTPAEVNSRSALASSTGLQDGKFTSTALAYARAIANVPDTTRPGTPGALTAYTLSNNAIHLTWTSSTDNVGVAGYSVYRDGVLVGTTAYLFWQDSGLSPTTTYAYTVEAYDAAGNTSPATPVVNGRTNSAADTIPPSVPGPVTGAPMSSTQIEVQWGRSTDNVKVVAYKVFRNATEIAQATTPFYSDTGLTPGTSYSYSVSAVDNSGNVSARSVPAIIMTSPRDARPPSVPADVSAVAGRDIVYLSWTPSSDNIACVGYHIFRNGAKIGSGASSSYQDTTVKASTTYTYTIAGFDAAGNVSQLSAPVTVTTPDTLPPSAPGTPAGVPVSTTQVRISWSAASDNIAIAGYRIFRNGVHLVSWGLTQYMDTGLSPATAYTYTVVAVDSSGNESAASAPCTVSTQAPDTQPPTAPAITAIAALSTSQVNLAWSASTDDGAVVSYGVFRDGVQIGSTPGTGFANTGLTAGTTYAYAVRAVDAAGNVSALSPPVTVKTLPPPDTTPPTIPAIESATAVSETQIVLKWSAATDNTRVGGYYIYRNGVKVGGTGLTSWMDSALASATTYSYTVAAVDASGNISPRSAAVTTTTLAPPDRTPPSAPSGVQATAVASNRVSVTWAASTDNVRVAGYKVFRNGKLIAAPPSTSFVDEMVFPNATYAYTIAAYDAAGNTSAQSPAVSVVTPR